MLSIRTREEFDDGTRWVAAAWSVRLSVGSAFSIGHDVPYCSCRTSAPAKGCTFGSTTAQ